MAHFRSLRSKFEYDAFFTSSLLEKEMNSLHFHLTDRHKPRKIVMKTYSDDETMAPVKKEFFVSCANTTPQVTYLFEEEKEEVEHAALLEVPISKLKAEVFEMITNKAAQQREEEFQMLEAGNSSKPKENQLWTDKYMPNNFVDLLSDDQVNREVLTWLKTWDPTVFKRKLPHKNIGRREESKQNEPQRRWDFKYDLEDKIACDLLKNKMILLAGPPGSGKTTLARIVAKQCGYEPIEINASDDRTANVLLQKVENITKSDNVSKSAQNHKPSLLIIDEVDGSAETEHSGAMRELMKYIYEGKGRRENQENEPEKRRPTRSTNFKVDEGDDEEELGQQQEKLAEELLKGSKNKFRNQVKIQRPLIFICNDAYSRGLKELRRRAIIYNFRKPETSKLMKRLLEICKHEKMLVDHDSLLKICEENDNDIRSCLNALEFLARKRAISQPINTLKDETFLVKKEIAKNLFDVIDDLLLTSDSKYYKGTNKQKNKKFNITNYCLLFLPRNTDYGTLSEGLFINYLKLKSVERDMSRACAFLVNIRKYLNLKDALSTAEVLNKNIFRHQHFELLKYTNLFAIQAHLKLASDEKIKVDFPTTSFEIKKQAVSCHSQIMINQRFVEQIFDSIYDAMLPKTSVYYQRAAFLLETVPFIYQIIQPKLQNAILDSREKLDLENAICIMIDFGLEVLTEPIQLNDRQGKPISKSWFSPNIERLLMFPDTQIENRMTEKVKILTQNNYVFLKNLRSTILQKEAMELEPKGVEINETQPIQDLLMSKLMNAYDSAHKRNLKRKEMEPGKTPGFLFKFREGYSSAVRYDLKMDYFFRLYNPPANIKLQDLNSFQQMSEFDTLLRVRWASLFEGTDNKGLFVSKFDKIQMRAMQGGYLAYFNPDRNKNKPIYKNPFEDEEKTEENNEPVIVYKDFDEDAFNFNKCNPKEVLFYVNLDTEEVISNEKEEEIEEKELYEGEKHLEDEITESENHPILINIAPMCPNHSIIALFPQEMLPQTIGQDMVLLLLQVLKICDSDDFRVGYNSIGGFSTVNHLHFQLFYASDLFPSGKYPIEKAQRKKILASTLQNPKEKINMYSVGVIIEEFVDYLVRGFVVRPDNPNVDLSDIYTSLAFVIGTFANYFLENQIAHNMIISEKGRTIYLVPRQYEAKMKNIFLKPGFFEIGGIAACQSQESYDKCTKEIFEETMRKNVSLGEQEFEKIKSDVLPIFQKNFVCS